ncbi:class I SAM-dependent methyltransferase [Streptomyces sp. NPDC096048]|uniref:class I SAM-dependent methyltransferase n=1 Tax=Streptomyces sp. NPDC096048 TaxID=3366072 RepID=UPI0038150D21
MWQRGRRCRALDRADPEAPGRHLGAGRGHPALDIGCGEGALTAHLAELGYRAVGVDWSKVDVHELDPPFHCYRPRP